MSKKQQRPTRVKDANKKIRKKPSVLSLEKVEYVDYKDVNLLTRFVSDRSKIKARRVTGNDVQQQNEIARAIKNAREMALLPYTKRVSSQRTPRGDREGRNTEAAVDQVAATEDETTDIEIVSGDEAGEE